MEKEEFRWKLQRTLKELRHSKTEMRELVGIKRQLKVKVTALEAELEDTQAASRGDSEEGSDTEEVESADLPTNELLEKTEDMEAAIVMLEEERLQLVAQLEQCTEVERELIAENDDLTRKLNSALMLAATTAENQQEQSAAKKFVACSHEETQTETSFAEKETQVDSSIRHGDDRAIQVDTLMEVCTQYQREAEMRTREVSILKEKLSLSSTSHKNQLKEAEDKIYQLLSFKEQLTKTNSELKKEIELLQPTEYQKKLSSALHSIQELEQEFCVDRMKSNERSDTEDQLKKSLAENEKLKRDHANEKQEMRQKLSAVVTKVKEREANYVTEVNDLRTKLDAAQKQLRSSTSRTLGSNAPLGSQNGVASPPKLPENSLISFVEVESIAPNKLDEGIWGYSSEAIFRGKAVAVRCLTKQSLARFSIQEIHKQVSSLVHLRHPNLALFLAASMDAPSGMMILTELLTCSLRQAYEARLMSDKLPVMLDIAMAVNFLHLQKKPIVHNNLNSCAVMLDEGAHGRWKAKLSDIGSSAPLMMLSEMDSVYLAPELSEKGPKSSFPSSDVYSFGVLLCEVALNSLPKSPEAFPGAVRDLKESIPQVSFLVQCCLAINPDERPKMANLVKKVKNLVVNKIKMP